MRPVALVAVCALVAGCGTDDWVFCERNVCPGVPADASADAVVDAADDAVIDATDAGVDDVVVKDVTHDAHAAPEDTPPDVVADAVVDALEDVPVDVPRDIPADVPVDLPRDVPRDVPVDIPRDTPPSCPAGMTSCGGVCRDTRTDAAHCGACNNRCASGQTCASSACVTPPPEAGATCRGDADCGPSSACLPPAAGFTGGYCIYACPVGSAHGSPCAGTSGACTSDGSQNLCYRRCVPARPDACRAGYICLSITTDRSLGVCFPNCAADPAAVCGPRRCDDATGECARDCTTAAMCSAGSTCNTAARLCECTSGTNCGAGLRCYPRVGAAPAYCGCATDAACAVGRRCDTSSGRCN